jgi:hypothetical protein
MSLYPPDETPYDPYASLFTFLYFFMTISAYLACCA